ELFTINEVFVNITGSNSIFCGSGGTTTRITFPLQHGSLMNISIDTSNLASTGGTPIAEVFTKGQARNAPIQTHQLALNPHLSSREGTKIAEECSGRGYCNRVTGHCDCYSKFLSSDGKGGPGALGNCGYFEDSDPPTNCTSALPLWGNTIDQCSGVGGCNMTDFHCNCTESYAGGACELKSCGIDVAWFEEILTNTTERSGNLVQCSGAGVCDESSGECTCWDGVFDGDACGVMACPSCGDHGECQSIAEFARLSRVNGEVQGFSYGLWDADKIRSCMCNQSLAVDGSLSGMSDTYRGPYSYTDTDWFGYDCSLASCPTGDNRFTEGVTDLQRINCTAVEGVFTLTFRDSTTEQLSYGVTVTQLEAALEKISTIHDVTVTFYNGTWACNESLYFDIEFMTENGDLPLLVLDTSALFLGDGVTPGVMNVTKVRKGTREDLECAAHGLCDESTGVCNCFVGYQSSDGAGGQGQRGDCGWWNQEQTGLFKGNGISLDQN
ncbi:unnamed protein product, partial [Discosporangium mesarthrocarpum]